MNFPGQWGDWARPQIAAPVPLPGKCKWWPHTHGWWLGPESRKFTAHAPQRGGWLVVSNGTMSANAVWFGNMKTRPYEHLQTSDLPRVGSPPLPESAGCSARAAWTCGSLKVTHAASLGWGVGVGAPGEQTTCRPLSSLNWPNSWVISAHTRSDARPNIQTRMRSLLISLFHKGMLSIYYAPGTAGPGNR